MRLLLDTHAFLWSIGAPDRLSDRARRAIEDGANDVFLSAASAWEIAIKAGLGRVSLPRDLERFVPDQMARNSIQPLPVDLGHALRVFALPDVHRDPFDRLLVAQAIAEELTLVSRDRRLKGYAAKLLW
ncbi:MAG: type II toxin-antitoxin system VapC family toxin [Chloroflexota bacterium]|nr:type II toxin-antitoxin system VapC family toxin [Chloroflexota bacterium]